MSPFPSRLQNKFLCHIHSLLSRCSREDDLSAKRPRSDLLLSSFDQLVIVIIGLYSPPVPAAAPPLYMCLLPAIVLAFPGVLVPLELVTLAAFVGN